MSETDTQAVEPMAPVTDTPDTQPSETSEPTSTAPEATQEEAKAETEVKAEETAAEKLYAGKYKNVDDLEKSYKELESKFGREASEKAELTRVLNEVLTAPETPKAPDTEVDPYDEPTATPVTEKLERDTAVLKFIVSHNDADAEAMKQVLATDPLVSQIAGHEAKLEYAYLRSQSLSREKALADAKKEGQVKAEAKIAEKEVAKVESAKKAEPPDEDAELYRQITSGTPDERERARKAYIKKNLVNL